MGSAPDSDGHREKAVIHFWTYWAADSPPPKENRERKGSINMERLFHLKEYGTTAGKEVMAGLTTFFAMAYIIAVNPTLLSQAGM